jgi:hypothetical protein
MAAYNPYNSEQDYYSPYENVQQSQGPSIGNLLFNTAKTMATFGVLNAVGRGVTKVISTRAASYFSKRPGSPTTIGGILKNTSPGKALSSVYSQATKPFRSALNAKDAYVSKVARTAGPTAAKVAGFKSSFKDMRTFAGSVGRAWKNTVLTGAGVAYAIDTMAGVTKDYGLQPKEWYDVPGKVGNFGKWLAMDSIYSMGFSGAIKMAGFAGANGLLAAKTAFKGPLGNSIANRLAKAAPVGMPAGFRKESFHGIGGILNKAAREAYDTPDTNYQQYFVSRAIRTGMAFGKTVQGAIGTMNETVHEMGRNFKSAISQPNPTISKVVKQTAGTPIAGALRQIRDMWKDHRNKLRTEMSPVDHVGLNTLQFADELAAKLNAGSSKQGEAGKSLGVLTQEFKKIGKAQRGKRTVVDKIFPEFDKVTNRDIADQDWVQRTEGTIAKAYGAGRASQFMKSVLNMHAGLHIYKAKGSDIVGGGVNLSFMDPLHVAKRTLNAALNHQFNIPGAGQTLSFGNLLQTNFLLGETPSFDFFRDRQDFEIGPRARSSIFKLDRGDIVSTGQLDQDSWFTAVVNGNIAMVGPGGTKLIDTGNRVVAVPANSSYKKLEENRIKAHLQRISGKEIEEDKLSENKYMNYFLQKSQLSWPTMIKSLGSRVLSAVSGKSHSYVDAAKNAFSPNPQDWHVYGDVIHALKEQVGQDLRPLMRNKDFMQTFANVTHAAHLGDSYDVAFSARSLRDQLDNIELNLKDNFGTWLNKRGIAEEVALIKASPQYAQGHIVTNKLGHRLETTAYDKVRLAILEDGIVGSFDVGSGREHPLASAIPELVKKGTINKGQAKSLDLFVKLSAFTETGMFDQRYGKPSGKISEIGQQMISHSNKLNWDMQGQIIDYVQKDTFRSASKREVKVSLDRNDQFHKFHNNTAYVSVSKSRMGFAHTYVENVFNNVTNMLHDTMFPFRKDPIKHSSIRGNMGYLFGGIGKIAAGTFALKALDAAFAANPLFDDTALESGLTGFAADNIARLRLGQSKAFDALGFTGIAKHLNGLLPGFTTSAPGAAIGAVVSRTMGGGWLGVAKGLGLGAIGNRLLSPYLPDFTKSYDQLESEYRGETEVPIMNSPTWLLGTTPYEGSKVAGFQPNWYVRTKSRWKETDTLYGSTVRKLLHEPLPFLGISIGDFIDPYYMERKHFFSRPYPETGEWGKEIPLVGTMIAGTFGRIFKPKKTMHQEFLTGPDDLTEDSPYPFAIQPPTFQENRGMMYHTMGLRKMGGRSSLMGSFVYGGESKMWGHAAAEDFLSNVQQFAGLPGFLAGTVREKLVNTPLVMPTLETAGRIASMSRSYYDMNLGGMGVFTEPVRRLIEKPDYRKYGINPIPNLMPNWLPQEYLSGDPYAKIMRGELRLPGKAYQTTHRVKRDMPARSSMFGAPEEHMVRYFTGLLPPMLKEEYDIVSTGTTMHAKIQDQLAAEGLLIQAEALVYDVKNDISGHVDAIIRDGTSGKGRRALEIKSINEEAFQKLDGPKDQHVGQLNFYLKELHLNEGSIMYVSRDNPGNVKLFNVRYSQSRFYRDLKKLQKARQVTADLMAKGTEDKFGYSYSWLDRLNILADVAPTSAEFKEAKFFVEKQIKSGILNEKEMEKYSKALKHRQTRLRKYELYPNRFKGKVFSPDTERNIQSINEDIRAGAEYTLPERIIGAAWETFTNSNTFLTNKLMAFKDPLEHYKMLKLYGKEYKPWDELYGSFVEPTTRAMFAQTNPIGGAYKWGLPGYVTLGPAAGLLGGVVGSVYGSVHGLFRAATDSVHIPEIVQERREIESYFDAAKYEKNRRIADLSQGIAQQEYIDAMNATLTAFNQNGEDVANLFRATPYTEKPYIEPWLNLQNSKERREVLKYIPKELGAALKKQWSRNDAKEATGQYDTNNSVDVSQGSPRLAFDRRILDPSVQLEDIKLKTIEEAGLNAHDFGLGWNEQMYRLQGSYNKIHGANMVSDNSYTPSSLNPGQVRQTIIEVSSKMNINASAQVYINEGADDVNSLNITIRRDRSLAVINALRNREKYHG